MPALFGIGKGAQVSCGNAAIVEFRSGPSFAAFVDENSILSLHSWPYASSLFSSPAAFGGLANSNTTLLLALNRCTHASSRIELTAGKDARVIIFVMGCIPSLHQRGWQSSHLLRTRRCIELNPRPCSSSRSAGRRKHDQSLRGLRMNNPLPPRFIVILYKLSYLVSRARRSATLAKNSLGNPSFWHPYATKLPIIYWLLSFANPTQTRARTTRPNAPS